jgi:hypothetical protein
MRTSFPEVVLLAKTTVLTGWYHFYKKIIYKTMLVPFVQSALMKRWLLYMLFDLVNRGQGLCWWTVGPKGLYSPVAKFFGTCLKIRLRIELWRKSQYYKHISKWRIICLMHSCPSTELAQFHGTVCLFQLFYSFQPHPPNFSFFSAWASLKTWLVEIGIWCIKICIILVLHPGRYISYVFWYSRSPPPRTQPHGLS